MKKKKKHPRKLPKETEKRLIPVASPVTAALLAWLVFGLGHVYLGKRWKGVVLFGVLTFLYVFGMFYAKEIYLPVSGAHLTPLVETVNFVAFLPAGLYYLVSGLTFGLKGDLASPLYEIGWLMALSAALLNALAINDAWDIAWGKKG